MNRYRAYMNRIHAPSGLRHRVLESAERGQRPRRPARRWIGAGTLAACFALAFFGGWQAWQYAAHYQPDPTAGVADPPAVITPAPAETAHTLVVGDPFDGQPHSFFNVPALEFADCTGCTPYLIDWDWTGGAFEEAMTAQEIITALGGTDEVPWSLLWSGFGLDGTAWYGGENLDGEQVLMASITGVNGDTSFTLELTPGQLPPGGEGYAEAAVQDYDGVAVTAWYTRPDGDGGSNYTYCVELLSGDMGVRFTCDSPDQETASWLSCVLVRYAAQADGGFTTEHLTAIPIPGRELSLEEAREEHLGAWLPADSAIPDGFTFGTATRYEVQNLDSLSAIWEGDGALMLRVTVYRSEAVVAPEADLTIDQVTTDTLRELGEKNPSYTGKIGGWRWYSFVVDWGDGIMVEYSLWGLTVTEALALIHSAQAYVEPVEESEDSGVTLPVPIPDPSPWQVVPLE